jgi:hypothetical protein
MAAMIAATVASGCSIMLGCEPRVCEMWDFARSAILRCSAGGMTRSSSPTTYQDGSVESLEENLSAGELNRRFDEGAAILPDHVMDYVRADALFAAAMSERGRTA